MPRAFAIANQKGGVGKTTTAVNLAAALAISGRNTLLIDLDPQGNASTGLGVSRSARQMSAVDVLRGDRRISECAIEIDVVDNLFLVPSTEALYGIDIELSEKLESRTLLRSALQAFYEHNTSEGAKIEFVIIDCPPSLNLLTINALTAVEGVVIPLQCEFFALEGMAQFINTVKRVQSRLNPELVIEGIVLTMFDRKSRLSSDVADDAKAQLGYLVYDTIVPRSTKISEAPSYGVPVLLHDKANSGSQAYLKLTVEFLERTTAGQKV